MFPKTSLESIDRLMISKCLILIEDLYSEELLCELEARKLNNFLIGKNIINFNFKSIYEKHIFFLVNKNKKPVF